MELHDITKSYHNVPIARKQIKNAVVFHIKEIKDGVEKRYEFEINKVLAGKFAIKCKQCKCFIHLPNIGIQTEKVEGSSNGQRKLGYLFI